MRRAAAAGAAVVCLALPLACAHGDNEPLVASTVTAVTTVTAATTATTDTADTESAPGGTSADPATPPLTSGSAALQVVASGFERPVDVAWRDGDDRLYVVSQAGQVFAVDPDGSYGDAVLDLGSAATTDGERGLLGLAFHPTEPLAYVNYTDAQGDTVVAEYQVANDGTFTSARTVITIDQPYANHNGGDLAFGPDDHLYIGMGDGGSANDPERRARDLGDPLGKLLRIDPSPSGNAGYTVPDDNPYVGTVGALPEIWAIGLRNPWRFSFDPETGDLWIGDVGQGEWEEIDVARATDGTGAGRGVDFGWSAWEGTHRINEDEAADGTLLPVYEYPHGDAGCSVTGGVVSRGADSPALYGWYLFADWCSGKVWALPAASEPGAPAAVQVTELGLAAAVSAIVAGPDGALYLTSHRDGTVLRLTAG